MTPRHELPDQLAVIVRVHADNIQLLDILVLQILDQVLGKYLIVGYFPDPKP